MVGGPVRQPYAGVDIIPQLEIYEFGLWTFLRPRCRSLPSANVRVSAHRLPENQPRWWGGGDLHPPSPHTWTSGWIKQLA
jgi:hypothetical protein